MKFISSIVLLLAVASLAAPIDEEKHGGVLACPTATPFATESVETGWTSTNIYAVQVCAVLDQDVENCGAAKPLFVDNNKADATESSLTLNIVIKGDEAKPIPVSKVFQLGQLVDKKFCHTFEVCDILEDLKDKNLEDSMINAAAVLVAQPASGEAKTFKVTMQATSYVVETATPELSVGKKDVQPFSVVCNNYPCTVTADNKLEGSTQTLTIVDTKAPQCPASKEAAVGAKNLYVSVFKCATAAECPEKFAISDAVSSSPSPTPSTSESGSSQTEGSETEGSETEGSETTESSGALHITGMGSAFIATILAFIA